MARKAGVNKSEEIRQLLKANPELKAKEVQAKLAETGLKVTEGLIYYIKGNIQGKKSRKQKARKMVAKVAATTGSVDALATILKVKSLATDVGGLKKLKALVEALSD